MKILLFFTLIFLLFQAIQAQESKIIKINTLKENVEELKKEVYRYPQFLDGKVIFKEGNVVEAKLNYHRVFDKVLFIGTKGDTLALGRPETTRLVVIQADTFYYYNEGFLEQVTHYPGVNLFLSKTIRYIGKEKAGAYGAYSGVTSVNSASTFNMDDMITFYLELDENAVFKLSNNYFLSDRFTNFFDASKKGFYNLFDKEKKELKTFLDNNKVNFNARPDLEKTLRHMHSL